MCVYILWKRNKKMKGTANNNESEKEKDNKRDDANGGLNERKNILAVNIKFSNCPPKRFLVSIASKVYFSPNLLWTDRK